MRCLDVQIELEAYVDGEISPERAALLERHLVGCDACQAELARLQAVVAALETWPLVAEPSQLTARVMARLRPRPMVSPSATLRTGTVEPPALPGFRLHWSDFAISLAGAGLVFATTLLWRYLAPTGLVYLHSAQMDLRLELLRLEVLVLTQYLARMGAVTWGLLLVGVTLVTVLPLAMWERGVPSVQAEAQ